MRPQILNAPGEFLFAILMAASPIVGSIWVDPDVTKWIVFGVGVAMTLVTIAIALRPVKTSNS
ncbi:MAG TPA: hypothetical protein VG435_13795 [Acidimicrobiales bacterium]|nr:hypothetical protein [Acidimicrobiales bacterium]